MSLHISSFDMLLRSLDFCKGKKPAPLDPADKIIHSEKICKYSNNAVLAYSESNHGPDGRIFLDIYFIPFLRSLNKKKLLDAGCGAAPWSIFAAKNGAQVFAVDIQEGMIQAAKKAIKIANTTKIKLEQGDVANLPYKKNFFDAAISICVGCNLPLDSFEKHFYEFQRCLKKNGEAIVSAPCSLDVVFTSGSKTKEETLRAIQDILEKLPTNPDSELIVSSLLQLSDVLSATFYLKNGRLKLLESEQEISEGDKIWRKLPKLIVPNRFYTFDSYTKMFRKFNFEITNVEKPKFTDELQRSKYNDLVDETSKLGSEYVNHSPFLIFKIKKK